MGKFGGDYYRVKRERDSQKLSLGIIMEWSSKLVKISGEKKLFPS